MPQGAGSMPGFPSSIDEEDVFRLSANPAFLPFAKKMSGGAIVEKPWSTKDLKFFHCQFLFPWRSYGITLGITHFGTREFLQSRVEVAAGKRLGKINIGIGLNYSHTVFMGYEKGGQVGINAGVLLELNEQTNYFNNISVGSKNIEGNREIDKVVNGLEYIISQQVCVGIAAIKNQGNGMIYQFNLIYRPVNLIDIDIGMITGISTVYFCVKYRWKNISVRSGFRFGQFIGVVPAIGVIYGRESE